MKVDLKFHSVHFDADGKLLEFIQEKVDKLAQFHDRITDGEVFLKTENTNTPDNKVVEIKLNIPGAELFAKKQEKSFEEATDGVAQALKRQLKKHKEKVRGV